MSAAQPDAGGAPGPDALRAVRRRWAGGVAVVFAPDGQGGVRGTTVSAFTAVSLDPPLVLVCLDRDGRLSQLIAAAGRFAVSILDRRHQTAADRFAGRGPLVDPHLTGIAHTPTPGGLPALAGALAWFDCRLDAVHPGGDHVVVVGLVTATGLGPDTDDPLLYYEGRYRSLEAE